MAEYIERSYIRKMAMFEMAYTMETETDAAVVLRMIDDAPAADVAPVVHGHFVHDGPRFAGGVDWWRCSACGGLASGAETQFAYCPNCGAKMDGGDNDAAGQDTPTVDAEVVVRCKECEHAERYERTDGTAGYYCGHQQNTFVYGERWDRVFKPVKEADDFCSSGERKEGAEC